MDDMTKEQRSRTMSHIRSTNTSIEVMLRHALWHQGIRYRKNDARLPGKPDIAITKYKIAIFCDGEFFHGKDWNKKMKVKTQQGANASYWTKKIDRNIHRDMEASHELESMDWIVLRFWGKEIKKDLPKCVSQVQEAIEEIKRKKEDL